MAINYRSAPLAQRIGAEREHFQAFDSGLHGDPATPVIEAFAGDPVKMHVLAPFSEQAHVFTIEGHQWPLEPGRTGRDMLDSVQLGAGRPDIEPGPLRPPAQRATRRLPIRRSPGGLPGGWAVGDAAGIPARPTRNRALVIARPLGQLAGRFHCSRPYLFAFLYRSNNRS